MLKVKDIMTKNVKFLYKENTLEDLIQLFSQERIGSVVIVNPELKPIQIITLRDLVKILSHDTKDLTIMDILNKLGKKEEDLKTVFPETSFKLALNIMHKYQISHLPVINNSKKLVGIISIRDLIKHIAQLTFTDELTKIYNRKYLSLLENKLKKQKNVSILLADLDNFKKINDTFGHAVGDLVLKEVAKTIERNIKDSDIVIRYGGEEFLIILYRCPKEHLFKVAERIRKAVKEITFKGHPALKITISIGGYSLTPGENINEAISKADKALYQAKYSGKNCTILWEEPLKNQCQKASQSPLHLT
ncbi:MAG: diguanylate cyclase [Caldimicrobium sp.]